MCPTMLSACFPNSDRSHDILFAISHNTLDAEPVSVFHFQYPKRTEDVD